MTKTLISEFDYRGQTITILYTKGTLSYTFELNGNRFGNAVKSEGRSIRDIMNACICLIINYLETREAAEKKHDSTRT